MPGVELQFCNLDVLNFIHKTYNLIMWMCQSFSCVWFFVTPWTVTFQAPLSMEFSRQEYWSGLPPPSLGNFPNPGIEPRSPALQADYLPSEPPGKPVMWILVWNYNFIVKTLQLHVSYANQSWICVLVFFTLYCISLLLVYLVVHHLFWDINLWGRGWGVYDGRGFK